MNIGSIPHGFMLIPIAVFEAWLKTKAPDYMRDAYANGAYYKHRRNGEVMAIVLDSPLPVTVWINPKYYESPG